MYMRTSKDWEPIVILYNNWFQGYGSGPPLLVYSQNHRYIYYEHKTIRLQAIFKKYIVLNQSLIKVINTKYLIMMVFEP